MLKENRAQLLPARHANVVAERDFDTTTSAGRRRSEKEHSNVETNNAKIRDDGGLENCCVDEETTGVLVEARQQVLVNGRWVTVTGGDTEYIEKLIVSTAQMERKMDLTVAIKGSHQTGGRSEQRSGAITGLGDGRGEDGHAAL